MYATALTSLILATTIFDLPIVLEQKTGSTSYFEQPIGSGTLSIVELDRSPSVSPLSAPRGATRIPVSTIIVAASCDASIELTSLRIRHRGLGRSNDIAGVYLNHGSSRVSQRAVFGAHEVTTTLRFRSMAIPACSSERFTLMMDIASTAETGGEHLVSLDHTFPPESTAKHIELTTRVADIVRVVPGSSTRVSALMLAHSPALARFGFQSTLGRVQLSTSAAGPVNLTRLTLSNQGTARDLDLKDLVLTTTRGIPVSRDTPSMRNRDIIFRLDPPLRLDRNSTVTLLVRGTPAGSRGRTIQLVIDDPADIVAFPARESLP